MRQKHPRLGVVHGLAEDARREGGDIENGAQRHAPAVLKARDALERHLLRDDVYVREAALLLQAHAATILSYSPDAMHMATQLLQHDQAAL